MSQEQIFNTLLRSALPLAITLLLVAQSGPATAQNKSGEVPGQVVEDNSGNVFMQEVIDLDKFQQEENEHKKRSNLERRPLTNEELRNVGMQITPSGSLIPLINRDAPPIREMGTRFTSSFEPLYPAYMVGPGLAPYGYPGGMPYGYPGRPYGYPGVPYGYPATPFGMPGFGGYPMFGMPFGNPFFGSPFGYGFGQPWLPRMPGLTTAPYSVPPYGFGNSLIIPPSYSYTWQSTTSSPQPQSSATFSTGSSMLSRPFWNGYSGSTIGGLQSGYRGSTLGRPSSIQYDSSTTFTPIPPSFVTDNE